MSSAPSIAGNRPDSSRIWTPLRSATSWAWPKSPNPVTSVTAFGASPRRTSAASLFSVRIQPIARSSCCEPASFFFQPVMIRPVPSGLVTNNASPGCAPFFGQIPSGWTVPTTASPYFGSASRIVCPPASRPPAARTWASAAAKIAPSISIGSSSGKAAIESASSGVPPIAKTSLSAFVAAIAP